jgi:hypothetical protein
LSHYASSLGRLLVGEMVTEKETIS